MIYFFGVHYTYVPKVGIVEVIKVALTANHICRYVELSRTGMAVKHPGLSLAGLGMSQFDSVSST